jgi:hypothetical protein
VIDGQLCQVLAEKDQGGLTEMGRRGITHYIPSKNGKRSFFKLDK